MQIISRLTVVATAVGMRKILTATRTIPIYVNATPKQAKANTESLDDAYANLHRELRWQMALDDGSSYTSDGDFKLSRFVITITHEQGQHTALI